MRVKRWFYANCWPFSIIIDYNLVENIQRRLIEVHNTIYRRIDFMYGMAHHHHHLSIRSKIMCILVLPNKIKIGVDCIKLLKFTSILFNPISHVTHDVKVNHKFVSFTFKYRYTNNTYHCTSQILLDQMMINMTIIDGRWNEFSCSMKTHQLLNKIGKRMLHTYRWRRRDGGVTEEWAHFTFHKYMYTINMYAIANTTLECRQYWEHLKAKRTIAVNFQTIKMFNVLFIDWTAPHTHLK